MAVITYLFVPPCTRPLDAKELDRYIANVKQSVNPSSPNQLTGDNDDDGGGGEDSQSAQRTAAMMDRDGSKANMVRMCLGGDGRTAVMNFLSQIEDINMSGGDSVDEQTSSNIHLDCLQKMRHYIPLLHELITAMDDNLDTGSLSCVLGLQHCRCHDLNLT